MEGASLNAARIAMQTSQAEAAGQGAAQTSSASHGHGGPAGACTNCSAKSVETLGKRMRLDPKKLIIFGLIGAGAGMLFPAIPGGPIGGAIAGAALSMLV